MKNYAKKALSMALALLMCFTVFALDWSGLRADAMGATNPKHRFYVTAQQVDRKSDSMDGQEGQTGSCTVTMKHGNGNGSGQTSGSKSGLTVLVDSDSGSEVEVYNAYKDSAYGYDGEVHVTITIENDVITEISAYSDEEEPEYFDSAYETVAGDILNYQTCEVDAVSGATYSSNAIMKAVKKCLEQARR